MTKSKGVKLDSALGKAAAEYDLKCGPTKSYTAAFGDGGLHLLDYLTDCVKVACSIPTFRFDKKEQSVYNSGYDQGCKDMLADLKYYCERE